jgi:DNA-binding beta-propeller fold protein YncE
MQLVSGLGSLWVLTCERGCSGEARQSWGRIVRIDPRGGKITASAPLQRPGALAVGAGGVYATDFWHDTVRLIDPRTLRVTTVLKLTLPFRFTARDNAFLPLEVVPGTGAAWIATERCALAHADLELRRVIATVRLPCDSYQGIDVGSGAVWVGESLLGVYRVDAKTNRIVARIPIGPAGGRFDPVQIVSAPGKVLAVGTWTNGGVLTSRNGLARLDPVRNRVEAVTPLPAGPLAIAYGEDSLWVGRAGGSSFVRIDPGTGSLLRRFHARIGTALAVAGNQLWTSFRNGTIRRLAIS